MLDWLLDLLMSEVHARSRNEVVMGRRRGAVAGDLAELGCECSSEGCATPITLTGGEYEAVRGDGATFAIAIDHENPELDRVVAEHDRYSVVEKWMREAATIARETDPRDQLGRRSEP